MAGKHSQKVTPCPESQQITVFLQHALSINAKGYFGLRTGNKSQHAIFLLRTAGRHSLSPDTRYLQVPLNCLLLGHGRGLSLLDAAPGAPSPPQAFAMGSRSQMPEVCSMKHDLLLKHGLHDGGWFSCCLLPSCRF